MTFAIFNIIMCAITVIVFVTLWAAVCMNGRTVGRPEDDYNEPGN